MGRITKALGLERRVDVERGEWGRGLTARDGSPLMSRTDPATGRALDFETRGFDGRGTPDAGRAKALRTRSAPR
jgi:hypothetical protein